MRTLRVVVLASLVVLTAASRLAAEIAATGGELQVNTYTPGSQQQPSVAARPTGDFVVVWQADPPNGFPGPDGSGSGIFGRRFAADGMPRATQFQVNAYTTGSQRRPRVAMRSDGGFVVAWDSAGPGFDPVGSADAVFLRPFDANGVATRDDVQVNTYTPGVQRSVAIAAVPGGTFVVVWESGAYDGSLAQDGSRYGVFGRRFDAGGGPLGGEFQVNTYTPHSQQQPAVAADPAGRFVVAWENGDYSSDADGDFSGVFARRFAANGAPAGPEFQVNTYTTGYQFSPTIMAQPDGGFVVAWSSVGYYTPGPDGSSTTIAARRYDAAGAAQGDEFVVNTFTTGGQREAAIVGGPLGDFVVTWASGEYGTRSPDGHQLAVAARHFAADGTPLGGELVVNTYATGRQSQPTVTADPTGRFVVAWASGSYGRGQDGDGAGVFARRFHTTAFRKPTGVRGARLVLRDHPTDRTRRRIEVSSDDRAIELGGDAGIVVDDPTIGGATLRVRGGTFDDTYTLPAANWRRLRDGWQYSDPGLRSGPIRRARVRAGRLVSAKGLGAQLGHALAVAPEPVTVMLQLGTGQRWCIAFGGHTHFVPDRTFRAADAPAPSGCPT